MGDTSVAITGATVDVWQTGAGSGDVQQVFRDAHSNNQTVDSWTLSTTARPTPIPADVSRLRAHLENISDYDVYIRVDATTPTSAAYQYRVPARGWIDLDPQDGCKQNIRMIAAGSAGTLVTTLGGTTG